MFFFLAALREDSIIAIWLREEPIGTFVRKFHCTSHVPHIAPSGFVSLFLCFFVWRQRQPKVSATTQPDQRMMKIQDTLQRQCPLSRDISCHYETLGSSTSCCDILCQQEDFQKSRWSNITSKTFLHSHFRATFSVAWSEQQVLNNLFAPWIRPIKKVYILLEQLSVFLPSLTVRSHRDNV